MVPWHVVKSDDTSKEGYLDTTTGRDGALMARCAVRAPHFSGKNVMLTSAAASLHREACGVRELAPAF
jgi:hypothetical protein